ncbi:MAG: GFA family protein [Gammaproteobacteria bacterium]|nr:GFA family protein [Gammaproteobacteria bacterium]
MTSQSVTGGCFCGAIRFRVDGPEKFACYCYCESCQRAAGAPVVAWATYDRESFDVLQGSMHWHHSSPGVTRGICSNCGSCISYENDKRPDDIDIAVCCLDEPDVPLPRAHIWTEDKQPSTVIGDDLPVYERNIG